MRYAKTKIDGKTKYRHRVLVERRLGRPLTFAEVVHHKNGDRLDNRARNLEVMSRLDHSREHMLIHPISKPCIVCGRTFTPRPSHRARDKTCGGDCRWVVTLASALGPHRFVGLHIAEMLAARARGESLRSIGRRYDVAHNVVARMLRRPARFLTAISTYQKHLREAAR